MGYKNEELWKILIQKVKEQDTKENTDIEYKFIAAIEEICQFAIDRAKLIRDTFPMYTLHDEVHICNVMRLMTKLLGDKVNELSRNEAAMLVMSACCHDIGMSYSEDEKKEVLKYPDRFKQYLNDNPSKYVVVYKHGTNKPEITDDICQDYFRSIHHERIQSILNKLEWPLILNGQVEKKDLIRVCKCHGEGIKALDTLEKRHVTDLRMCTIMLRLADILDFDTSRAPRVIYEFCGFSDFDSGGKVYSKQEWEKNFSSNGFDFDEVNRENTYELQYSATCKRIQIEQAMNSYLDWVDKELDQCGVELRRYTGKWNDLILPMKVKRNIDSEGYVSGQYHFTMDQKQVMKLLAGERLYKEPYVFVRELTQNAIDAVRTRQQMDHSLASDWKPQIDIRTWIDKKGYYWFRIEDNGIGMTEEIIKKYFLKIGQSYYTSDDFKKDKIQNHVDDSYAPISQFGIGILSCFLGNQSDTIVEVSTKYFGQNEYSACPSLRLRIQGMNGFYYLANQQMGHEPGEMQGITEEEKMAYRNQPGTVIAVRTNFNKYRYSYSFKEILDKYVYYPLVSIHYKGPDGVKDYMCQDEFIAELKKDKDYDPVRGIIQTELRLSQEQLQILYEKLPELVFPEEPKLTMTCILLDQLLENVDISGAVIQLNMSGTGMIRCKYDTKVHISWEYGCDRVYGKVFIDLQNESYDKRDFYDRYRKICADTIKFDLSLVFWYKKFFLCNVQHSVTTYNGIVIDDSSNLLNQEKNKEEIRYAALLLKDTVQPKISLSRDRILHWNLKDAITIEILRSKLYKLLYKKTYEETHELYVKTFKIIEEENSQELSLIEYLNIFTENKELFRMINEEFLYNKTKNEIDDEIKCFGRCQITNVPSFNLDNYIFSYFTLRYFSVAALQFEYELKIEFIKGNSIYEKFDTNIYATKKSLDEIPYQLFPPCFFLRSIDGDGSIFAARFVYLRYACNADHRFSKWLISNRNSLHEYVPGIYSEILYCIRHFDRDDIISKINDMLRDLREILDNRFGITDELFLTEADFID